MRISDWSSDVCSSDLGTAATDAVNVSQLYDMGSTVASYFGGGAAFANGAWTAPVYVIQGGSHGNVGDAFAAVDGALSTLATRVTDLEAAPGGGGGSEERSVGKAGVSTCRNRWSATL